MALNFSKNFKLRERGQRLIPSLTQTFSKGPSYFVQGASPVYVSRGEGCYVWDVDNNKYIDYTGALGAIILGYNNAEVNRAITEQL
ncbi:MAG: aminotransferase class III-fold pyridoxal phosphate-dependent enzyme, partial [Thermodesulfobacteriota bacterium]